ncbi:MAG: 2-C-methyl-D-erythritol 2,4-cyclodiphosphate synthase [Deltaproteobacteria bacterium]|nr:2-C-methyl-D-erythritol 2,4-cyclodiphosphate synthase [Deltaproteobacteria bacterium]
MADIPFRIGIGYDIHRFGGGRPLVLGGVVIPDAAGLQGHSDADVLLHAAMDALLGAAGLPDIGHYFPNTDPQYRDISSVCLLRDVAQQITNAGFVVGNLDVALIAQRPRVAEYIPAMKAEIAATLEITASRVGIKATTNEQLGALGRGEGIAALATALLVMRPVP